MDTNLRLSERLPSTITIGVDCFIGYDTVIKDNVCIQNHVSLLFNIVIKSNCKIFNGVIIGPEVYLDEGVIVHANSVICFHVHIGPDTVLGEFVEIASRITIGKSVKIFDHVKIFGPDYQIGDLTILGENSKISSNIGNEVYIGPDCLIIISVPKFVIIYHSVELMADDELNEFDIVFAQPSSRQLYEYCLHTRINEHM